MACVLLWLLWLLWALLLVLEVRLEGVAGPPIAGWPVAGKRIVSSVLSLVF
jgi:hypothetical protein